MLKKKTDPIEHYLKTVQNLLPFQRKQEKEYLKKLKIQLEDYVASENLTDSDTLFKEFGTPQDIAQTYLSSLDLSLIIKNIDKRNIIQKSVVIFCILLIILTVSTVFINYGIQQSLYRESEVYRVVNERENAIWRGEAPY